MFNKIKKFQTKYGAGKEKKYILGLLCLAAFLALIVVLNYSMLQYSPFESRYTFQSVSQVFGGYDGKTYVIDGSSKMLLVLNQEKQLVKRYTGGSLKTDFYYAQHVCDDKNGNIYVADIVYGSEGNRILQERILQISDKETKIIFEQDYQGKENPPLQYGNILELKETEGKLYFTMKEGGSLVVYSFSQDSGLECLKKISCGYSFNDASYDITTQKVFASTRQGDRYIYDCAKDIWTLKEDSSKQQIIWDICAQDGEVYYTDLLEQKIAHQSMEENFHPEWVYEGESIIYKLNLSRNRSLLMTDFGGWQESFLREDGTIGESVYYTDVPISDYGRILLCWGCLVLCVLILLGVLVFFAVKLLSGVEDKNQLGRVLMVGLAAISVSLVVSYSTISNMITEQSNTTIENMKLFADLLAQRVDVSLLGELDGIEDYHSAIYDQVKAPLDEMIDAGYEKQTYYYYLIYNTDGEMINCLMDYEESTTCGHPAYEYGENEYTQVFQTGEPVVVADDVSSYGSWAFVLLPLKDSKGSVVAEIEVGTSLDQIMVRRNEVLKESVLSVFCSSAVVTMLVLEILFIWAFFEKSRKVPLQERDITQSIPIRTIVFLVYMTDSMQDAFIAILCSHLYESADLGVFSGFLSEGLAIALPMSAQLLFSAVFALFGGRMTQKFGTKKILLLGFAVQTAGFIICCVTGGYVGILLGKVLIGIGQGTVYVAANTMAALGEKEEYVEQAFADVSAGVLSGVTIGVGLGSIVLSLANYKAVYMVGAIFLLIGFFFAFMAKDSAGREQTQLAEEEQKSISTLQFLFNRKTFGFFALILLPFMMSLSYREYFFPLYVEQFGIDEVGIGRIYLICGMGVLYLGPKLAKTVLDKLGAEKSIIFASILMAANMGIFVIYPSLVSVIAGVVILSTIISFAYTCQYSYFEKLPECSAYGEGSAMGIYSMVENLGQTLGPMVYGSVMILGYRTGITFLTISMFVLIGLFVIFGREKKHR